MTHLPAPDPKPTSSVPALPIVGIGASAGGLRALEQLFRALPALSGKAYVVVSHLAPDHVSLLTEILQRAAVIPVVEAEEQQLVVANTVYVIPPNRDLTIKRGRLHVVMPPVLPAKRNTIDHFFQSLASHSGQQAIAVILSGSGGDGTQGLKSIVAAGGLSLVQSPDTAQYKSMPEHALQSGFVHQSLSIDHIAQLLARPDCVPTSLPLLPATAVASGVELVLQQLRQSVGHDFLRYKKNTVIRRIERRMTLHQINDWSDYADYVKHHTSEATALLRELLINVTHFFRDQAVFELFKQSILPALLEDKPDGYILRIWVAGCATGEEAYSIAIVLREYLELHQKSFRVQIYATDLDDEAIAVARSGIYKGDSIQTLSPQRLARFFTHLNGEYRVNKVIRDMLVFAVHNVLADPPFTKLDLISCRNVLIYLDSDLQNQLITRFHFALKTGGILLVSPSEGISHQTALFEPVDRKWKFYRALSSIASTHSLIFQQHDWKVPTHAKLFEHVMQKKFQLNMAEKAQQLLAQCFAPISVITDETGDVLYVHGDTGKYLRPSPGEPSFHIADLARPDLVSPITVALHAANNGLATLNQLVVLNTDSGQQPVELNVRLFPTPQIGKTLLLFSFRDHELADESLLTEGASSKCVDAGRVEALQRELLYTRENHQATIYAQQLANEELKSTVEELQSTNEELQSTNEELEISKEELQSVNEEVVTVNAELQNKIELLADMQNDMKNLLDNINIGTIFLDQKLAIRRFTREATHLFRLMPADIGRPLGDIKSELDTDLLLLKAKAVLTTLSPSAYEGQSVNGETYSIRLHPYYTLENAIEGVVLTFADISERVRAGVEMQRAKAMAECVVDSIRDPLLVLDSDFRVTTANQAFCQFFSVTVADTIGHPVNEINASWRSLGLQSHIEKLLAPDAVADSVAVERDFPQIGRKKMVISARRIISSGSVPPMIVLTLKEVG